MWVQASLGEAANLCRLVVQLKMANAKPGPAELHQLLQSQGLAMYGQTVKEPELSSHWDLRPAAGQGG